MTSSLQKGIDSAKSGQMEQALVHLKDAIVEEPENANVWVWLSAIIEDEEKQSIFLKKALEIDPQNKPAQRGLAFIQRKKYIPPKPGERLSDYTHPIGTFKAPEGVSPAQGMANIAAAAQSEAARQKPPKKSAAPVAAPAPQSPAKRKPVLDILLYGLTLMVFIVIGIIIGTTLLTADIPFLTKPEPVLIELPEKEGMFIKETEGFQEMKLHLNNPTTASGIPATDQAKPELVVNTHLVQQDKLVLFDAEEAAVPFTLTPAEGGAALITVNSELDPARYCLVYNLNPDKQEALYWCFQVNAQ